VAFDDLLNSAPLEPVARPDDVAKLLLTSGSTGRPKAVVCTHANIALNAAQIQACYADPEPPVLVNSAPWSHSLGANAILHMVLHRGGTLYIDAGQPAPGRFDETIRNLREVAPTYHNMVPAGWGMFVGELERDEALAAKFFETVRVCSMAGPRWRSRSSTASRPWRCGRSASGSPSRPAMARPRPGRRPATSTG
jgi:feruloyl-CoA synthase